jgi:hypothetical protein
MKRPFWKLVRFRQTGGKADKGDTMDLRRRKLVHSIGIGAVILQCKLEAGAADSSPVNEALVRKILLEPTSWLVTSTQRDPPGPIESWEYTSEVKIVQDGDKLKMEINNHQLGNFTSDVILNDDGFGYDATHAGKASMHYHPEDKKYPFHGSASGTWSIVWSAKA